MQNKLLLATTNQGKLKELRSLLAELPEIELLTPQDWGRVLEVDEVGVTYAENAALKARAYAHISGLVTLADDSGLEVDALFGAPGLHSARYSPHPGATDADRRAQLLNSLDGKARPWSACFRCVVAIAGKPRKTGVRGQPPSHVQYAEGLCKGEIVAQERGAGGFGYDPIFLLEGMDKTMAELTMDEKNKLSHRAKAVKAALPILRREFGI